SIALSRLATLPLARFNATATTTHRCRQYHSMRPERHWLASLVGVALLALFFRAIHGAAPTAARIARHANIRTTKLSVRKFCAHLAIVAKLLASRHLPHKFMQLARLFDRCLACRRQSQRSQCCDEDEGKELNQLYHVGTFHCFSVTTDSR